MKVAIVGIGMHPFGRTPERTGVQQGAFAARLALKDAGVAWRDMQFAYGGSYSAGNADAIANELGQVGVPFTNVVNGCATGGSALLAASKAILSGEAEIGLVVGFDKHDRGAFNASPAEYGLGDWYGEIGMMVTTQFFAAKIMRYMHDYGISRECLAGVAEKAYVNGALNENAWRREPIDRETILESTMVNDPLTKFMFCSPGEGGVALVVCREDIAHRYCTTPITIASAVMTSKLCGALEVYSPSLTVEPIANATEQAARQAWELAGIGPEDIDLAQIQDTEAGAEVMHMAENGFCEHGEQEQLIAANETALSGKLPVNTDGGCLANGEPIGASGLRQIYENVLQLRGHAGARQISGQPKVGYTHVYGAPGISAVTILQR
jgi:acetyl-CoA acetyltransferase